MSVCSGFHTDIEGDLVLLGRTEKDLETAKSEIESSSPGISVHSLMIVYLSFPYLYILLY